VHTAEHRGDSHTVSMRGALRTAVLAASWAACCSSSHGDEGDPARQEQIMCKLRESDATIARLEARVRDLEQQVTSRASMSPRTDRLREILASEAGTQGVRVLRSDHATDDALEARLQSLEASVQGQNVSSLSEDVSALLHATGLDGSVFFDSGDCAFMLSCFAFTFLMTLPGLALFYGGLVRVQNVLSIVMQTFSIACLVTVLWIAVGYSLCFSDGNGIYGNHSNFWLRNLRMDSFHPDFPHVPEAVFVLYQLSFAILTPALICGSFADRMRLSPMLIFMACWWAACVFCPLAHVHLCV